MTLSDDARVLRFVRAAEGFVALVENPELKEMKLIRAMLPALAELYAAGVELESVEIDTPEGELPRETLDWKSVAERFIPHAGYWMVFNPTDHESTEPVAGNLGDDVADIYMDVIRGLRAWNSKDPSRLDLAVWEWQFHFRIHWGYHALGALNTLHWIISEQA
jgi:hypothetical protein